MLPCDHLACAFVSSASAAVKRFLQSGPQGLLCLQDGGLDEAAKILQEWWRVCHVTHDEMAFSDVIFSDIQACLFSSNLSPFKRNEDILLCFT